ncbi:hypothetical protein SAMN06269250_2003 [Spirosoma fluviale]|uniref:Uncharacterized protein n=1 Tax=Spirosoma fluviale TaxID=1597977 RepID=A0A286FFQ0_9BACT|nr:hypothetical protein SAMN06269250_2003 [Spirosoma fluviale]
MTMTFSVSTSQNRAYLFILRDFMRQIRTVNNYVLLSMYTPSSDTKTSCLVSAYIS